MDSPRTSSLPASFDDEGFAIFASVISGQVCDEIVSALARLENVGAGSRALIKTKLFVEVANAIQQHPGIKELLAENVKPVQCTLFAKGSNALWSVTPHQDLSIPVREQQQIIGWRGWSQKEGMTFVQPPDLVLEQLVAVRLQLDDHSPETGPLEVVPGTHLLGRLSNAEILKQAGAGRYPCLVPRGGAVVIRPLIIHSSDKPKTTQPRRVLQYLFGPPLPDGMHWGID
ncbi:MAG TPA: phytanoyl-CoA dioxygenase family protein [Rhodanobacter sp.]